MGVARHVKRDIHLKPAKRTKGMFYEIALYFRLITPHNFFDQLR